MQQEKIYRRSDISTEKNGSFPGGKKKHSFLVFEH